MPRRTHPRGRRRGNVTTQHPHCGQCGQQLAFVRMTDTGASLPIDPYPVPDGNVCAAPSGRGLAGWVVSKDRPAQPGHKRYAAHFGTCPERPNGEARQITVTRAGRVKERAVQPDLFGGES